LGYSTLPEALRSAFASPRSLYAGVSTTLLRNIPYNAVQFGTFSLFSRFLPTFVSGFLAGIATAIVTTPIDVVNTRLQTQAVLSGAKDGATRHKLYNGPVDAVLTMLQEEGWGCFWRGSLPRAASYAPSALVFFAIYDALIALIDPRSTHS
jgi:hypothetical protein